MYTKGKITNEVAFKALSYSSEPLCRHSPSVYGTINQSKPIDKITRIWYTVRRVRCSVIRHEDLVGSFEQKKALAAQFNLMDDTFFSVVMEHNDAAEYLLTQLLDKPVKVVENKTQYSIRNVESHSIVLDTLVEDEDHNLYDV